MIFISQGCFLLVQFSGKNETRMVSRFKASKCPGALFSNKRTGLPVWLLTFGKKIIEPFPVSFQVYPCLCFIEIRNMLLLVFFFTPFLSVLQ